MTGVPQIEIKESISDLRELMKKQKSGLGFAKVQTFFSVKPRGDAIIVTLNTNHSAYQNLVEILEEDVDKTDMDTLRSRLVNSLDGLKLLLMAWARYEDEQPDGKRKSDAQDARIDWGRIARRFLENE